MPRPLCVYGWQSFRPMEKGRGQTREICAASSGAEVARIMGVTSTARLFNFGITGNVEECEYALARPRVVCFRGINALKGAAYSHAESADNPAAPRVGFRTRRRRPPPVEATKPTRALGDKPLRVRVTYSATFEADDVRRFAAEADVPLSDLPAVRQAFRNALQRSGERCVDEVLYELRKAEEE